MLKRNFLFLLLATYLVYQILSDGTFGLYRLHEWHSTKSFYQNGLMSAQEFISERQTLAGHQLNLSEWNGFNEVLWDQQIKWNELSFKAKLQKNSYLWIFIFEGPYKKLGFRLSLNANFKSGFYTLDQNDLVLDRKPVMLEIVEDKFYKIRILSLLDKFEFYIDDKLILMAASAPAQDQIVSFRGSFDKVTIDDVQVQNGEVKKSESFSTPFRYEYLIVSLAICFFLWFLLFIIFRKSKNATFYIFSGQMGFVFLFLVYTLLDQNVWAPSYYFNEFRPFGVENIFKLQQSFEKNRKNIFHQLAVLLKDNEAAIVTGERDLISVFTEPFNRIELSENLQDYYKSNGMDANTQISRYQLIDHEGRVTFAQDFLEIPDKAKGEKRILFLGTSQTWGGGARSLDKSYPAKTIRRLNKKNRRQKILGFNLAEQGVQAAQQLAQFEFFQPLWHPDLVVVDLGNNDSDINELKENLEKIILLALQDRSEVLLLKEANSFGFDDSALLLKHQMMQALAEQYHIQILDLHGYMKTQTQNDVGILWWDVVHFSSAGHLLVADWLSDQISKMNKD